MIGPQIAISLITIWLLARLSKSVDIVSLKATNTYITAPKIVSGVGNLHSKVPDGFKDRLGQIKKTSGRGNTIKL